MLLHRPGTLRYAARPERRVDPRGPDSQAVQSQASLTSNFGKDSLVASLDPNSSGSTNTVNILPPRATGCATQALVLHWVETAVFRYEVTLNVSDNGGQPVDLSAIGVGGGSWVDLTPPLVVIVPRKGPDPKSTAVFINLKQGNAYQAYVVAKGNTGGTAPETRLNSEPATAVFDFTAGQDVEDTQSANVQVTFDPVPFSGNLTLIPINIPPGTTSYDLESRDADGNATLYAASYEVLQTMTLQHLRTGIRYQVRLTAKPGGQTVLSEVVTFDPNGQDVEQDRVTFPAF